MLKVRTRSIEKTSHALEFLRCRALKHEHLYNHEEMQVSRARHRAATAITLIVVTFGLKPVKISIGRSSGVKPLGKSH